MGLRVFADHCVATSVIDALSATGSEVLRLREHLAKDAPDPAVIEKAQLHPLEVIRSATRNAALTLKRADLGLVQTGFKADLLLVDGIL
jgi:cytosine/adenosine deaminase-related metal-dependent hydrolase